MSVRPARTTLGPMVLLAGGTALALFALVLDPLRGKPLDLSLYQCVALLIGALAATEGALQLAGRPAPALFTLLTGGSRTGTAVTYLLALGLGAALLYLFRAYAADDSFITFRYARNLAHGLGVVWNPGEAPVEGYSNFLWMLLASAALKIGIDPLAAARTVAILCYGGSLVAVRALAIRAGSSRGAANLAVLGFAAIPAYAYWAVSGLETLSVVLLSLLYFLALTIDSDARTLPWRSAVLADLLLMSRPDTPLLIVLAVLPLLLPFDRARRAWLARLVVLALPVAALYLGWKWLTFHRLFANTVSAKLHLLGGLSLVTGFFAYAFPLIAALIATLARNPRPLERPLVLQVLAVAAGFSLALLHAASPVGHYYRFFLPVLAPMLATLPLLADRWADVTERAHKATFLVCTLAALYAMSSLYDMVEYANAEARGLQRAHVQVAQLLRRNFTPDRLLAASDCGVLPYLSEMRTIDIWGLTDRRIAEHGFDAGYVMKARPDAIVLHSLHPAAFTGRDLYDRALHEAIAADPSYRLAGQWEFLGYWLWVYSRAPLR
jgi:arabinofuranosyltransferase